MTPPLPPLALMNRVCSLEGLGDPAEAYEALGADARRNLLELLGPTWSFAGRDVLDFGCGAGRTLRQFLPEAEGARFVGVDIDAPSVAWLRQALSPPIEAQHGPTAPPLPFDDGSFDLVWALSVFTHLTDTSLAWLLELHRLLKPDGLLIATYMGHWNSAAFLPEPWEEDAIGMNVLRPHQGWDAGGPMVLMSDWWVREFWGRLFHFEQISPNVQGQSWALLRRRDVSLDLDELERPAEDPREVRALRNNVRQLGLDEQARIEALTASYEHSWSWRVTAPLRQISRRLRR